MNKILLSSVMAKTTPYPETRHPISCHTALSKQMEETADIYGFIMHEMGMKMK